MPRFQAGIGWRFRLKKAPATIRHNPPRDCPIPSPKEPRIAPDTDLVLKRGADHVGIKWRFHSDGERRVACGSEGDLVVPTPRGIVELVGVRSVAGRMECSGQRCADADVGAAPAASTARLFIGIRARRNASFRGAARSSDTLVTTMRRSACREFPWSQSRSTSRADEIRANFLCKGHKSVNVL